MDSYTHMCIKNCAAFSLRLLSVDIVLQANVKLIRTFESHLF